MSSAHAADAVPYRPGDYSLVGDDSRQAGEQGLAGKRDLAEADWYQTPAPRN